MKKDKKSLISPFAIISLVIFVIIDVLYMLSSRSAAFADRVNSTIAQSFRQLMASIGNIVPFSLFELLIILLPFFVFLFIWHAVKVFKSGEGRIRFIINIAAVVLLIYSGHLLALGIAHNTTDIGKKLQLNETKITTEELTEISVLLRDEINELAPTLKRDENGIFTSDYSYRELSEKILESYDDLSEIYDLTANFYSSAKGVYFGEAMSYLGITGIYTYPTGEANVNTAYPSYVTIFTAAHEMSHQRGVLRENEANFMAFLLTVTSDDPNLRYSGLLNIYEYVRSALYRTDREAYYSVNAKLSPLAKIDINAAYEVADKYDDNIIERISERINDMYLKSSGSSDGVISYSRVVRLVVNYYNTEE